MVYAAASLLGIASALLALLAPKYAVDHTQHVGAWQGALAGKNSCAAIMVIGLSAALVYAPKSMLQRATRIFMMLLFAVIISMADSSGALVVIAVVWVSLPLLRHLAAYEQKTRALITVILFIGGAGAVICMVEYLPLILKLLNRDPTLTGRTDIWKGESANVILAVKWALPNAHNGFLDIWLSLGGVGLALFGYALLKACRRIWQILLGNELKANLWMIAIVILVVTFNLDESVLIAAPSLMWILLASAFCGLEIATRREVRRVRVRLPAGGPRILAANAPLGGVT
jgi:O-antigen ligase